MAAKADNKKTAPAKQAAAKQAVAKKATEKERTPYDIVLMSRDKNRPTAVKSF